MIWIIGGTSESREFMEGLSEKLKRNVILTCVTEGAKEFIPEGINTVTGRMDKEEMKGFIESNKILLICDFSHPFAEIVTKNARKASEESGVPYMRFEREGTGIPEGAMIFDNIPHLKEYMKNLEGTFLITTGSKNAADFVEVGEGKKLVFRVLPEMESIRILKNLEVHMRDIIAAAGPFSEDMNRCMIREYGCDYLVTKETGTRGGFPEKISAALKEGIIPLVIKRQENKTSYSMEEIRTAMEEISD